MSTKRKSAPRPTSGNRSSARGHRPRAAILKVGGAFVLRLDAPDLAQLRVAAQVADDATLTAWEQAARSLLAVWADEQAARFDRNDAAESAEGAQQILTELTKEFS